jgi:hypothetical protein
VTTTGFEFPVSGDRIEKFFQATAWQLPHRPSVPPTLATVFRQGEFELFQKIGIPLNRVLHAEQKYKFHKDLFAGATYVCSTGLESQYEKKGLRFFVLRTDIKEPSGGATCIESFTTIVVKGAP